MGIPLTTIEDSQYLRDLLYEKLAWKSLMDYIRRMESEKPIA